MNIKILQQKVANFRDARRWGRYHTPKNLAQALASEVGELNDLYLWDREPSLFDVQAEIADLQIYILSFADITGIDLAQAVLDKLAANERNYPVKLATGNAEKHH